MGEAKVKRPDWGDVLGRGRGLSRSRRLASETWTRVVEELSAAGMLYAVDVDALQSYCVAVAQEDHLVRVLFAEGWTVVTERGVVKHPAVTSLNQVRSHLRSTRVELGLGPKNRAALGRRLGGDSAEADEVVEPEPVVDDGVVVRGRWDVGSR